MNTNEEYVADWAVLIMFVLSLGLFWLFMTYLIWLCMPNNVSLFDVVNNQLYHITHLF